MELFASSVPFLKILIAFALMLIGIRKKLGLALSILVGGIFLGLMFGLGPVVLLQSGLSALVGEKFLFLMVIVGLILILSDGLEQTGQSKRLMDAVSGYLISPRLRLIFFPALIGLLPMPGGAVFSAPMVKAVSEKMALKAVDKVVINYWFRHVWETAWPLYPGIILTVSLAEIPIYEFVSKTWPGVIGMFIIGWFFFLRPGVLDISNNDIEYEKSVGEKKLPLVIKEGTPLFVAIVGAVGMEILISRLWPGVHFEWGVIGALLIAVITVMIQNRLGFTFVKQVVGKKSLWNMLAVITAIFIFKEIMGAADVVTEMAEAAGSGAALFAAAMFLPFLVGMVSGINVAFVGATFPLLLGLLETLGLQDQKVTYLILATYSGFTGVMISPLHICFILTNDFFGADLARSWKRMVLPSICLGLIGVGLFYCW